MTLSAGVRLGPYEIVSSLGAGGMGEVYRARDTKLNRDVALKVLPELFALDPDRLARFKREAQVLALLNHPNIAAIYGFEDSPSTGSGQAVQALVLELVDGPTLADRIARGPIAPEEALPIARQIAEALEAAHEQGVIHRDLKPANIKVRPDGTVKVLDFGLAKALQEEVPAGDVSQSPTLSVAATRMGVILGTAAYMAPEQARGKPADKRCDIWAFGCVLYEMLTGRRAFDGQDITDTIVAIVSKEPDWRALPAATPPAIRLLLRRCAEKDAKRRLRDIGEARVAIEETLATPAAEVTVATPAAAMTRPDWRRVALVGAATLVVGGAIAGATVWWTMRPAPPRVVRTEVTTTGATALAVIPTDRNVAITPDGSRLIYRGNNQLLVRAFRQLEPVVLSGLGLGQPRGVFVSPDGQWIGFFDGTALLKKVAMTGGPPVVVTPVDGGGPRGATWGPDGTIVFATVAPQTGLQRVPAAGGESTVLTKPDRAREVDHVWPEFLPNGQAVLFTILPPTGGLDNAQIAVLELATGVYKVVVRGGHHAHYVPTGHLVYGAGGTLRAVAFDLDRREVVGTPVPVLEGVSTTTQGGLDVAVAADGTMVYVPGGAGVAAMRSLVWVDRQGREEPIGTPPRGYFVLRLSPDATRVALDIRDQENDIWVWHFARRTLTRLTFGPALEYFPVWTPDGRRIVFASGTATGGDLFWQSADGTGAVERLSMAPYGEMPMSFSPDGKSLLITEQKPSNDLSLMPMDGKGQTVPLVQTMFGEGPGEISPDGRWLAYQSNESGQNEIYVRPLPDVNAGRWQVSSNGGTKPVWARNGRELFYLDATGALTSVPIQTAPAFSTGNATKLFDARFFSALQARSYDVTPDGKRFLFIKDMPVGDQSKGSAPPNIVVVLNWFEELKHLVPVP